MSADTAPHPMKTVLPAADKPALTRDFEFLTPEYTAARTIVGLEQNEAFILTHPEFKPVVEEYFNRILAAFDHGAQLEGELGRNEASVVPS
jgi:hypothetical protein